MINGEKIARAGLAIKAIKLSPNEPFTWASGYRMPIYNDNRMFLFFPQYREMIAHGFGELLKSERIFCDVIAGTSTSGISPATTLADKLRMPVIYVRDKPKEHGLRNQIEGIDAESDLQGRNVVLIEDLISTGGSSAKAVQAIRNARGTCNYCFSIFNYGFDKAQKMFRGEEPYDNNENKLVSSCEIKSLLNYETLLKVAKETGWINEQQLTMLAQWRADPFGWGEKQGFPKV